MVSIISPFSPLCFSMRIVYGKTNTEGLLQNNGLIDHYTIRNTLLQQYLRDDPIFRMVYSEED